MDAKPRLASHHQIFLAPSEEEKGSLPTPDDGNLLHVGFSLKGTKVPGLNSYPSNLCKCCWIPSSECLGTASTAQRGLSTVCFYSKFISHILRSNGYVWRYFPQVVATISAQLPAVCSSVSVFKACVAWWLFYTERNIWFFLEKTMKKTLGLDSVCGLSAEPYCRDVWGFLCLFVLMY